MMAAELVRAERTNRRWLARCNEQGFLGLRDLVRSGRPATYRPAEVAEVLVWP
ncbi:MAG TPA: hypothetical protein VF171_03795 [Trueperaceae bacterium]